MTSEVGVTVAKDGYELVFYMDGELYDTRNVLEIEKENPTVQTESVPEIQVEDTEQPPQTDENVAVVIEENLDMGDLIVPDLEKDTIELSGKTYRLDKFESANASLEAIDWSKAQNEKMFEETIPKKSVSRLRYDAVYENTDIIYDVDSGRVKESIVMEKYSESLSGYRYILETDGMKARLTDTNRIELYDEAKQEVIMALARPYLVDDAGDHCFDVKVTLKESGENYILSYELPKEWLADEERKWPVILDPVVEADTAAVNILDQSIASQTTFDVLDGVLNVGWRSGRGIMRTFIAYEEIPQLTSADVIVGAAITMYKPYASDVGAAVEVHKVKTVWDCFTINWSNQAAYNPIVEDYVNCQAAGYYSWDVTDIVREWYAGDNTGMMFKVSNAIENAASSNWKQFYSSDYGQYYRPTLSIMFRNNNGLESYWDYTSASAGRAGTGYINNYTGNLVWTRKDIGLGGNRMPVTISHVYNANDSLNNQYGMGYGWRTNYNQRVYQWTSANAVGDYYVWEDSDGTSHYFKYSSTGTYKDEDGLELTLTTTGSGTTKYCITDKNGNKSYFDTNGRLTKLQNNQKTASSINITYTTTSGYLISTVTDGVGRKYEFTYSSNLLNRISYKGTGSSEVSYVTFGYNSSKLTSITDKDGETVQYAYTTNNLLSTVQDIDGYKLAYTYNIVAVGKPSRVKTVQESDGSVTGGKLTIGYAQNQTTFTDISGNVQIMQFNNWGNTVSIQDDLGRAQYAQYANNDSTKSSTAKGNQLTLSSKLQNTVGNMLDDSSFENSGTWSSVAGASVLNASGTSYIGSKSLKITQSTSGSETGASKASVAVEAGQSYAFSAYVKTGDSATFLSVTDGTNVVTSDTLAANKEWTRLEVTYTAETTGTVTLQVLLDDAGTSYVDCVQFEKAPVASRYNLVENGDFRYTSFWSPSSGRTTLSEANRAPATELDASAYGITGNPASTNRIEQNVKVSGNAGDTFVLAGWAKGDSVPLKGYDDSTREFAMVAIFKNTDGTTTESKVQFNPYTDSTVNWQYAAAPVVAKKAYSSITIRLAYDHNANTVYFDGIQLYKESFGNSYTYDSNGNVISVKDLQEQTTKYEYTNNNLTKEILPTGAKLTYTYDNYHNVKTAVSEEGIAYSFNYDDYGNNTEVSVGGTSKITATAAYSSDGNRMVSSTDATGNTTTYSYNADTNVLEWVKYPEDTETTKTEYTYDAMYRLATVQADVSTGNTLSSGYTYGEDLLTKIETGTTTYDFTYGNFGLCSEISVGSHSLAKYKYEPETNRLKSIDYSNCFDINYTYDKQGRLKEYIYDDGDTVTYEYDNNGALASVANEHTERNVTYYRDFTERLVKYVEEDDYVTHAVEYTFDNLNNVSKQNETINGELRETEYTYDNDNRLTSVTTGASKVTYVYDAYGRLSSKTSSYNGTAILTETYTYHNTSSVATSGRIASVSKSGPGYQVTHSYTYDDNGNILSISDGSYTTTYVYDSYNQLIRENDQKAGTTKTWTYDNGGNILERREYAYTTGGLGTPTDIISYVYGDSEWGDLLTAYDGINVEYNESGYPASDGNLVFSWKDRNGPMILFMGSLLNRVACLYDTDGTRVYKYYNNVKYFYSYNEGRLTGVTLDNGEDIRILYDGNSPAIMEYGNEAYQYVTNLQGDVIALLDTSGNKVVEYTYDAWGKPLTMTGSKASTVGTANPLRYRGYCYDVETGWYYLNSRYYDPERGRFISVDTTDILDVQGDFYDKNLFAYCDNNPVVRVDHGGQIWIYAALGGGIAGGLIGALSYTASSIMNEETITVGGFVGATLIGIANGAIGGGAGTITTIGIKLMLSFTTGLISGIYTKYTASGTDEQQREAAMSAMITTSVGTFLGTTFDTNGLSKTATVVANYFTTISVSTPTEIINVVTQKHLRNRPKLINSRKTAMLSKKYNLPERARPNGYVSCLNL